VNKKKQKNFDNFLASGVGTTLASRRRSFSGSVFEKELLS
jgi:hypothetical protein